MSALSTEYIKVPVTGSVDGAPVNVTLDQVELAIVADRSNPADSDWRAGSWETGTPPLARLLIGPDGGVLDLAAGSYDVWVRVTDDPERPVMQAGRLTIT